MRLVRILVGIVIVMAISAPALAKSTLEEHLWEIHLTQGGSRTPEFMDRVTFKDGKLESVIFSRRGFKDISYKLTEEGEGVASWKADEKNQSGSITYSGKLQGTDISGTFAWKQASGEVTEYSMKGSPVYTEEELAEQAAKKAEERAKKAESQAQQAEEEAREVVKEAEADDTAKTIETQTTMTPGKKKGIGCALIPSER